MTDKEKNNANKGPEEHSGSQSSDKPADETKGTESYQEPEELNDYYYSDGPPRDEDTSDEHDPDAYPHEDKEQKEGEDASAPKNTYDPKKHTPPPPKGPNDDKEPDEDNNDDDDDQDDDSGGKMPFLEHLEELRWTILRSMIAVAVAAIGSYFFSEKIITFLVHPAPDLDLIYLAPTEGFMMYIKVALYSGIVIAFPYIAYQFWLFVVPGLLDQEKKYVPHIAFFTTLCFVVGAVFAYLMIIPFGLKFLLSFQTDFMTARIAIGKYLGFVVTIILVFGAVFELPVLSFFLTHIGFLTPDFLKKNRRYGIVTIFICAALLTPPDVFTQLMLAGPMILLYEISIWVSRSVYRKKKEAEADD